MLTFEITTYCHTAGVPTSHHTTIKAKSKSHAIKQAAEHYEMFEIVQRFYDCAGELQVTSIELYRNLDGVLYLYVPGVGHLEVTR